MDDRERSRLEAHLEAAVDVARDAIADAADAVGLSKRSQRTIRRVMREPAGPQHLPAPTPTPAPAPAPDVPRPS
jgi:hypothetical protein